MALSKSYHVINIAAKPAYANQLDKDAKGKVKHTLKIDLLPYRKMR